MMKEQSYIDVNKEEFKAFIQQPNNDSVIMLNLLKFKSQEEENEVFGEAVYKQYMKQSAPFFNMAKAEILFYGSPKNMLIGPVDDELWDKVLLVKYKTKSDFLAMVKAEGYPSHIRAKALQDSRLIYCQ